MSHVKIIQIAQKHKFSFMDILVTIMCDLNFDFIMLDSFSNCQLSTVIGQQFEFLIYDIVMIIWIGPYVSPTY